MQFYSLARATKEDPSRCNSDPSPLRMVSLILHHPQPMVLFTVLEAVQDFVSIQQVMTRVQVRDDHY